MKRVQTIHRSRKSAAAYLAERGWERKGDSLGDWKFIHSAIRTHTNLIIQLRNGTWEIQAWGCVV